jgi:ribonuclease E
MALDVVRLLILTSQRPEISKITVTVADDVADYLNNRKRRELTRLEDQGQVTVQVLGAKNVSPEHLSFECRDREDRPVKFNALP